jgi:hypothetical protein
LDESSHDGLAAIGNQYAIPVIFGVLTAETAEQAMERAGGKAGNRGADGRDDVLVGVGDDGAVLQVPAGSALVVSTDTLVWDVHFSDDYFPEDIGYKALAVNLSDLAAMAAQPAWASLALTLPSADEAVPELRVRPWSAGKVCTHRHTFLVSTSQATDLYLSRRRWPRQHTERDLIFEGFATTH